MRDKQIAGTVALLVIFILSAFAQSVRAQNKQTLPSTGEVLVAEQPLPSKVYAAQQNVVQLVAKFYLKSDPTAYPVVYYGSGFVEEGSGLVVTARHLLVESLINIDKSLYVDNNGIFQSVAYDSKFFAVIETPAGINEFPLTAVAMDPLGTYADAMFLKSNRKLPVQSLKLVHTASVGDIVYASGFVTSFSHYHDADGIAQPVENRIKFNFRNTIIDIREDSELRSAGMARMYILVDHAQGGFSGGPLLNTQGQVLGITIEVQGAFTFVLSSRDIANLISSVKK